MKRTLISIICLLLITVFLAVPVLGANSVSVSLKADNTTVNSGDKVTVTVSAKVDACKSGSVKISYDSSVFELVSGEWKIENTIMQSFNASGSNGVFALASSSAISGTVLKFTLKVKDSAAIGSSKVTVSFTGDSTSASKSITIKVACAHKWDDGKVTKEATCSADGEKTFTCKLCGGTKTKAIDAKGHKYDDGKVTTNATCTAEGVKTYTCSVCSKTKTESISAKGHSYGEGKVTQEATCSAEGVVTHTCDTCGKTKTTEIDPLPHTYDNDCDAVCNVCQQERTIEHKFEWATDGVLHWQVCTVCEEKTESENCTFEEELSADDKQHGYLCTVCGHRDQAADHDFHNDCDTECETCGYTRQTTHIYSEIWIGGAEGHWHECTSCGDKLEIVPHTPGDEATETTDQICIDCGYILQVAGNHQHSMAGDWLSDENGHWFLCFCGEYTEAEDHGWNEGAIDGSKGIITYTCTTCGQTREEEYIAPTTQPTTQPTETDHPTEPTEKPDEDILYTGLGFGLNLPTLLVGGLGLLLLVSIIFNIYLLRCLFASKKTGKYARKEDYIPPVEMAVTPIAEPALDAETVMNEFSQEAEE